MARILSQNGWSVRITAIGQIEKATKEWLYQKALLDKMEILPVQYFYESDDKDEEEYRSALSNLYVPAQVYVDALFGVGLSRKVSGVYRAAIEEWNEHKKKCGAYGVAVDICSGLDAKSGQMLGACVKADVQITFGYGKVGQFLYPGASLSDQTIICDIGMPNEAVYHVDGFPFNCLEKSDAKDWLGSRCLWGNKGTFGRVVIIAGSSGMAEPHICRHLLPIAQEQVLLILSHPNAIAWFYSSCFQRQCCIVFQKFLKFQKMKNSWHICEMRYFQRQKLL